MIELTQAKYQIIPKSSKELHLLIVEDVLEDVELILRTLKSDGIKFSYDLAESELDYRQLLKDNVYDAILSDYHLVDFDIFEVLRLLQKSGQEIPLILITEELQEKEALSILKAGVNNYLFKERLLTLSIILERAIAEYKLKKEQQLAIKKLEQQVQQETRETLIPSQQELVAMMGIMSNITECKQVEEALLKNERRFRALIENANDLILIIDANGISSYVSPSARRILGYTPEKAVGQNILDLIHVDDLLLITQTFNKAIENPGISQPPIEYRVKHHQGHWCFLEGIVTNLLREPAVGGIIVNSHDITQRKRTEEQWKHDALHDPLTHLPNRTLFMDRLEQTIKYAERRKDFLFGVLFIDLDRFKIVNDSLGHHTGDELIIMIAKQLKALLRNGDTIARLGADEFAILLEDISAVSDTTCVAHRIQEQLTLPIILDGNEIFISASIGIALSSTNTGSAGHILRDAEIAMQSAKDLGRGCYQIFCTSMHTQLLKRLKLENNLQRALKNLQNQPITQQSEFILHYQPIVFLTTNQIIGFEALVRWQHPELGFISPTEFIPLAEETGLIIPLGLWVLRKACFQLRQWQNQLPNRYPLKMSVNLSVKQFAQTDLIDQIDKILLETQLDGKSLKLEITESALIENNECVTEKMSQLRARNIELCIDDFGTGYSSLSYLHRFPMNTLKIDRSFVNRIGVANLVSEDSIEPTEIIRSIITLSHNLGIDVVAEGVETSEQVVQLQALRCEYGQGYLFSKPLDMAAATGLVSSINKNSNYKDSNSYTGEVQNLRCEGTLNWEQGIEKKQNNCTS